MNTTDSHVKYSGKAALDTAKTNKNRSMSKWASEFNKIAVVQHHPKFSFNQNSSVFTIGSCFARNVENHLRVRGIKLLSEVPTLPGDYFEIGGIARTGYQNVYTPGSVLEAIKLVNSTNSNHSIVGDNDQYYDLLTSGLLPLPEESALKIRSGLISTYKRLNETDILIITLGYNESWNYIPADAFINRAPSPIGLRRRIDEFYFESMTYQKVMSVLEETISLVRALAPQCKIIFTVSPVPLAATFTHHDVVVANQQSKSTLLAAATELRDRFEYIDYFPSYEVITNSDRNEVFEADGIHVKSSAVKGIMDTFLNTYLS